MSSITTKTLALKRARGFVSELIASKFTRQAYAIMFKISVTTINAAANHFVERDSFASSDFALFLERNVSELPPNAPERPEVFPDWMTTTAIRARQISKSRITTKVTICKHLIEF